MREGTGISLGVAGLVTTFFTMLAALLIVVTYVFVSVYAIVKLIGDQGQPDPATLIVGFVLIVTTFAALLLVGLRYLGGSMIRRKRED